MVKIVYSFFTFLHSKSAGRPERMGHNTCKSMGPVLSLWLRGGGNWSYH